jgi:hypothetical protein
MTAENRLTEIGSFERALAGSGSPRSDLVRQAVNRLSLSLNCSAIFAAHLRPRIVAREKGMSNWLPLRSFRIEMGPSGRDIAHLIENASGVTAIEYTPH